MFGTMPAVQNSILMTRVIEALFSVVGRRTLDSHAVKVIQTVLAKLEPTFEFLHAVTVDDELFLQGGVKVSIDPKFDTIESRRVGKALDTLIRVIYVDLVETTGEEVGLFFITELKEHLGDLIIDDLRDRGVNLETIQKLYPHHQKKGPQPPQIPENEEDLEPEYSWDTVSTWKYDNNVCLLYDGDGGLLDTIQLDLLVEEYVHRVMETTDDEAKPTVRTILRITEKDDKFLTMLQRRDIDVEYAVTLLHISRQKLETMIQKLLQLEMLQYISDNEVKLTEKGLQYLLEKKEDSAQRSLNGPLQ